jgi:uncharacterized protein (DUF2141 family)
MHLPALLLPLVLPATALAPPAPDTAPGILKVTIQGVRATQGGTLVIALYGREPGWLTLDSARAVRRIPVVADTLTVLFDSLPEGTGYAVVVIHDRNGNDKLDMRWLPYPKPKEGSGVSNNHVRKGPPEYEPARVAVGDSSSTILITMRY